MRVKWILFALIVCELLAQCVSAPDAWTRTRMGLDRLRETFKKSGDRIREGEGLSPSSSISDKLAFLGSYLNDTLTNPPFKSVELNFQTLFRNQRRLTRTIRRLHRKVYELSLVCNSTSMPSPACIDPVFAGDPSHDSCDAALSTKLVPIQGSVHTLIGKKN